MLAWKFKPKDPAQRIRIYLKHTLSTTVIFK
jgi:hypothetical protein